MDEATAADLETRLRSVMDAIAADLGVTFEPAKVTWTRDGKFTLSVPGEVIGASKEERAEEGEAAAWAEWVRRKRVRECGFRREHLGATFELNLRRYVITGYTRRSAERPVATRDEDGERKLFSVAEAMRGLGLPKPRLPDPRMLCKCGFSASFHRGLLGPITTDGSEAPLKEGDRVLLKEDRAAEQPEQRGAFEGRSGSEATVVIDKVYRQGREDDGLRKVDAARLSKLLCERFQSSGKLGEERR